MAVRSSSSPISRRYARFSAVVMAAGLTAGGLIGGTAAQAAGSTVGISDGDIGTTYATGSDARWYGASGNGGSFGTTWDTFDGSGALYFDVPAVNSQARVQQTYGTDVRPEDLEAFLSEASYTYAGSNVVFGIELFFTPADPQYGPGGAFPCLQATDAGVTLTGQCYTTIKWEPFLISDGAWRTVDLSADTAANSSTSTGGWKNTQRVGHYEKPGPRIGNLLSEYLAEMADYTVLSAGVQLGSGIENGFGWVKNVQFAGTSYDFAPKADAPSPAPVASSDALDDFIVDNSIDIDASTQSFSANGEAPGVSLDALDPDVPLSGNLPWTDQTDQFADVYAYSSPVFLGTFPIVNGQVVLTGVDLSALGAGGHRLVFIGQTSSSVQVVAIALDGISALAAAGVESVLPLALGGLVLLLLGAALYVGTQTSRRRV